MSRETDIVEGLTFGRPLSEQSLEAAQAAFDEVTPRGLHLKLKPFVGIVYVAPDEIDLMTRYYRQPELPIHSVDTARKAVETFKQTEILDPFTASEPLPVNINYYGFREKRNRAIQIRAVDVDDPRYPEQFRIAGERNAMRRAFGLKPHGSYEGESGSRPYIKIGEVIGGIDRMRPTYFAQMRHILNQQVELAPVDAVPVTRRVPRKS